MHTMKYSIAAWIRSPFVLVWRFILYRQQFLGRFLPASLSMNFVEEAVWRLSCWSSSHRSGKLIGFVVLPVVRVFLGRFLLVSLSVLGRLLPGSLSMNFVEEAVWRLSCWSSSHRCGKLVGFVILFAVRVFLGRLLLISLSKSLVEEAV